MKFTRYFILIAFTVASLFSFAQRGKDGSLTVTTANRILNEYTTLTADAAAGSTSITVAASGLNANARFTASLAPGDLIMIIQMQGASLSGTSVEWPVGSGTYLGFPDDNTSGGVIAYNNCGNYEFCQVATVPNASSITIDCGLQHAYTATGRTQIVRVPRLSSLTLTNPGSIACTAWGAAHIGGVIAVEVLGNTILAANTSFNATGLGFRGGALSGNNTNYGGGQVSATSISEGAQKGEGIGGYQTDYNVIGGGQARGAGANAGGGGDSHNSAGGGGANAGNIVGWDGLGNPDVSGGAGWVSAWNLEAAGFSAHTSPGGGKGGYSFAATNQNATTLGPWVSGTNAWNGDYRRNNGGLGGRPLDYSTGRLFLGGGGGAGDEDNNAGGTGGQGGGMIYVLSYGTITGTGANAAFTSNGNPGGNTGIDGAGGGGGGGTVVLNSVGLISGVLINAQGGAGGNQVVGGGVNESEGPGGGGGGGYVARTNGAPTISAAPGNNGTSNSAALTEFTPNGATKGAVGLPNEIVPVIDTLTTANVSICSGSSATLTAAIVGTIPGTITWYNAPTGGSILGTGTTYTTPVLVATTTYYVGICPGMFRKAVVVTVNAGVTPSVAGANQSVCSTTATLAGNVPTVGTGTWTLVSGTGTITNSAMANTTVTSLGAGANVFQWTITLPPCAPSSSQVTITNTGGPTTSVAGTNQTVCGTSATMAGNTPVVGTGLWVLVSGTGTITTPTSPTTSITGLAAGANVFQWTISNLPCPASSSQVTITSLASPTVANAGANQSVCTTSATLAGNTAAVGTGLWTLVSGSGTITSPTSPTSTVTGLGAGANVFQWTISNAPCVASTSQVTITNTGGPTTSVAGTNQTVCGTTATMAGNAPIVGAGLWTLISGTGTITSPTSPTTTITGLGTGANVFQWTISNLPCAPSSSQVTITSVASPTVANAGASQSICSTSATLAGNNATLGTGLWTLVGGTGTITTPSSPSSTVTGLGLGANTFQWTISNAPCASTTSQVIITNTGGPTTSVAGTNQTVCGTTATMAGNTPTIGTGVWTLISGTGTITTPTSPTTTITGLGAGSNVFQWSIINLPCPPSTSQVTITSVSSPTVANAGPNQSICSTSATLAGNTATIGTGLWTLLSGSGTITTPASPTSTVTGLGAGANVFQWTISNAPCVASVSQVTITNTGGPTTSVAGTNQTVCGTTATMAGNAPIVGTGLWTLISGTGTITTPASPTTTITGLGAGANVFQWEIDNLPCPPSTSQVTITSLSSPTVANAGPNQSICSTSATLAGNSATFGTGLWTLVSGSGTITTPTSPTSTVTGLGAGANVFQWTISNAPCVASTSQVTITNTGGPTTSVAGTNQTVCGTTATMAGNTPVVGTGLWTLISGIGTITTPTSPTTTITGLGAGSNVYQWEIDNLPCAPSTSQVTITSVASPTVANAGPNQSICSTSATLAGNTATIGTGLWTLVSGSGTITTPTSPTSTVTGLGAGANVFQWTISNAPCVASTSQVIITNTGGPTTSVAGANQTVCGTTATMAGNTPVVGTGLWTLISGIGTITTPASPTTTITGLGAGANVFQWEIVNLPCAPSTSQVTITSVASPTVANAGPNQSICSTSATLAGNTATIGTGLWTLVSGSGTITTPTSPTSTVTGLGAGANVFQWTISNAPCVASSSQVTITNAGGPTTSVAGANQTVCGTTATMAGNTPIIGNGVWNLVSGTGTITTPTSPTTTITGLGAGANVFQWEIDNLPCAPSTSQVTITSVASPTVANAGPNQSICSTSATLAGNTATIGTGLWTLVSGSGTITTPTSPTSTVTGLGAGANVFQWTISNAPCVASTSQVTITNTGGPTTAVAGANQTVCGTTATMAGNTPVVGTGLWTLISGIGIITTPTSPTTAITGLGAGANIFQWEIDNLPCAPSTSQVTITSVASPTVANAGPNQSICSTSATLAGNTATVGTGLWTLVSGSGTITTPTSPTSTVTGLGAGANVFQWTISNAPCAASTSQVSITVNPTTTIANAGINQTVCGTTTAMAGNAPVVGTGLWTLISGTGTIATPTSPTTTITGLGTGANVFEWSITSLPCAPTTSQVTITSNPFPSVTVNSATICLGASANLSATGAVSYTWSAGALATGTGTVSATPSTAGVTTYTVIGTSNGCSDTAIASVTVNNCSPPTANFSANTLQFCSSGCVNFYDLSTGSPTSWSWFFPGGTPATANSNGPINVCYDTPGDYSVTLIVSNSDGTDTLTHTNYIHILEPIPLTITGNLSIYSCESTELTAQPSGLSYLWGPNVHLVCGDCQTATVSPVSNQQYYVTYQDINGCFDSDTTNVTVNDIYSYFMPTGFSPNGDGINDLLLVHGLGVDYISLKIFDRVGEKVFETSDITEGWDGTYLGILMNSNEFVYKLEVTFCNGQTAKEQGSLMLTK